MLRNYLGKNVLKIYSLISLSLLLVGLIFLFYFSFWINLSGQNKETRVHSSNPTEMSFFETAFSFVKNKIDLKNEKVVAGIIPHHLLAADLIAEEFHNLEGKKYDTIILIGPNHFNTGDSSIISSSLDWETPYGNLEHDEDALEFLRQLDVLKIEEDAIDKEHSITSEVSFIKKTFPDAKFLPIILKPSVNRELAESLVNKLFALSQKKKILLIASIDFSHYKDSLTAQKNDKKSIEVINNFDFNSIYNLDIDSPASLYTLLKYSQLHDADFDLLNNSNSAILSDKPELESTTSYVTGYFLKKNKKEEVKANDSIRMLFFGDMMLDRHVGELIDQKGLDYIFKNLQENNFFDNYDLVSANLEGTVTNGGEHYAPIKSYDFTFKPEIVAELKKYNFSFFNLANNHFDDQGANGVEETRQNLNRLGFYYSGCESGKIGDCTSRVIDIKNKKIGLAGFSVFGRNFEIKKAQAEIKNLREKTDLVIINIHWGNEYETYFNNTQKNIGHGLIDAGTDLIIGHHSHVTQGLEVYQGKYIFYSLGNFVFDQYFSDETQKSLAVEAIFKDGEFKFILHPLRSEKGQVNLMEGDEKEEFLQEIKNRSELSDEEKNSLIN